jgi:AraC-like DNA-binding protein
MHYLASWRMALADDLLATTALPISTIAHRIGFRSEAGFSRAFSQARGRPPSAVRPGHLRPHRPNPTKSPDEGATATPVAMLLETSRAEA